MDILENFKQIFSIIKKLDNIELQQQLVELGAQLQEMYMELSKLREENLKLKETEDISQKIIRHEKLFLTRSDESNATMYCTTCWDNNRKLIQLKCMDGVYSCNVCGSSEIYDKELYNQSRKKERDEFNPVY